jgi:hypothetical protein
MVGIRHYCTVLLRVPQFYCCTLDLAISKLNTPDLQHGPVVTA